MAFSRTWDCVPVAVTRIRPGAYLRASSVFENFRHPCKL